MKGDRARYEEALRIIEVLRPCVRHNYGNNAVTVLLEDKHDVCFASIVAHQALHPKKKIKPVTYEEVVKRA